jgi:hypothetical protein
MNLKRRVERMENGFHSGLAAALTGWYEPLDSRNPELTNRCQRQRASAHLAPFGRFGFLTEPKQSRKENSNSIGLIRDTNSRRARRLILAKSMANTKTRVH